ncbi:BTAD domain-containing putative transcriptional regulator [Catenuloplanes sp. NPDC051500]|uniref:BTAD domain-containing putative transcriptional regulator n=1 Tax=Catenuloplanes sp. NPDC051500 TaxID=3363959 RepID=UPI003793D1E7
MPTGIDFRLLGPFEVLAGREIVRLAGKRQRLVLAALLLRSNHTVAAHALAAAVWGDSPPATAQRQLHMAVSVLRRTLGRTPSWGELRTEHGGYRLCVADERIDVARFRAAVDTGRQLAAEGRTAEAARVFRDGLALWRGPLLSDLDGPVRDHADWLEEMRLTTAQDCLEYEVAAGAPAAVVEAPAPLHDLLRTYSVGRGRAAPADPVDHYLHSAYAMARIFTPRLARVVLPEPLPGTIVSRGSGYSAAYRWFEVEYPNLIAALDAARAAGPASRRWQLTCAIGGFLDRHGQWADAICLHQSELAVAEASGDTRGRQHLHHGLGLLHKRYQDYPDAERHFDAALDLCRLHEDEGGAADVLTDLAILRVNQGRDRAATELAEASLAYYREHGEPGNQVIALNVLAWCTAQLGDHIGGMTYWQEALRALPAPPH